jgi:hypothetical protein
LFKRSTQSHERRKKDEAYLNGWTIFVTCKPRLHQSDFLRGRRQKQIVGVQYAE